MASPAIAGKGLLKKTYRPASKLEVFYTGGRVALSKDGSFVVCPCSEEVKVVDIASNTVLRTFPGDTELITAVAVGPKGRNVFSASRSLQAKWWDKETGECRRSWKAHDGPVADMAVDASGGLLATASTDRSVRVWDVEKGFCTHSFKGHQGVVSRVLFHPDAHRLQLFSAGDDASVKVWDLVTKTCAATLRKHFSTVTGLAVSTDGWTLLSVGRDKVANAWNLRDNTLITTVPVYEALEGVSVVPPGSALPGALRILEPALKRARKKSPAGVRFVTVGESGVIRVWDADSAKCVYEYRSPTVEALSSAAKSEDEGAVAALRLTDVVATHGGDGLMCATGDQRLVFYEAAQQERDGQVSDGGEASTSGSALHMAKELIGYNDEITDLRFLGPEGQTLAVATNSEQIRLYDLATRACSRSLIGHTDIVLCLDAATGPSGQPLLASAGKDHSLRIWDVATGACLASATGHSAAVGALAFSRRGCKFVVTGASDRTLKYWTLEKLFADGGIKSQAVVAAHEKDINAVAIAPNDSLACTGSQDRTARIWRLPELAPVRTLRGHKRGIWSVEFSPVDQAVLTASGDKTVRIWALADGSCLKTFEGHTASVLRATFLSRGTQIVSAGADGLVKLWTIRTNECVNTFDEHQDKIWALAASPDETRLATGGGDSLVAVWADTTREDESEALAEEQAELLKDQDLSNALAATDYVRALRLAFELRRPFRMLKVFEELLRGAGGAEKVEHAVAGLDKEHLQLLLSYIREWNSNARFCHTAQAVLSGVFRVHPPDTLAEVPQIKEIVEGLLPYSQRHFNRMDRLVRSTFLLDYTLASMSVLAPTEDAAAAQHEVALAPELPPAELEKPSGKPLIFSGVDLSQYGITSLDQVKRVQVVDSDYEGSSGPEDEGVEKAGVSEGEEGEGPEEGTGAEDDDIRDEGDGAGVPETEKEDDPVGPRKKAKKKGIGNGHGEVENGDTPGKNEKKKKKKVEVSGSEVKSDKKKGLLGSRSKLGANGSSKQRKRTKS